MHWWVEVYFPGIGWVEFDPTGGSVGQATADPVRLAQPGDAAAEPRRRSRLRRRAR